jgi:hypothetical protein
MCFIAQAVVIGDPALQSEHMTHLPIKISGLLPLKSVEE